MFDDTGSADPSPATEAAIRLDPKLSDDQKEAMLAVYRGFLASKGVPGQ